MDIAGGSYADLAGRTAIVTGGSKGIGLATAEHLAANKVKVAIVARTAAEVEQAADKLRTGGATALGVPADCTSAASVEAMVARVWSRV